MWTIFRAKISSVPAGIFLIFSDDKIEESDTRNYLAKGEIIANRLALDSNN